MSAVIVSAIFLILTRGTAMENRDDPRAALLVLD